MLASRELLFVLDTSPSMTGQPLYDARWIVRASLDRLRPTDTFNLLTFGGPAASLFDRPQPASKANLLAAERFLDQLEARRGSQIVAAIDGALRPEIGPGQRRFVVFLTDGAVARDTELIAAAGDLVARAKAVKGRAKVLAVSPSADRDDALLAQLAAAGETEAIVGEPFVDELFRYFDPPAIAEITIDWPGVVVDEIYPRDVADLEAGGQLLIVGRYRGEATGQPVVRGRIPGEAEPLVLAVESDPEIEARLVSTRWGQARADDLIERAGGDYEAIREELTALGLEHQLVTPYTSLFAIGGDRPRLLLESPVDLRGVVVSTAGYRIMCSHGCGRGPIYIHPTPDDEPETLLRYRVHFDASGEPLAVERLEGSFGDAGERCLEAVFHRVAWQGLPRERSVVEVQLQLRFR